MRNRVLQSLWQFVLRAAGVGMAAVGAVYTARVLGPEKLGISTYVFGLVTLGGMLAELNINNELVRRGRHPVAGETLEELISQVFTFRLVVSALCALAGMLSLLVLRPGHQWWLGAGAGVVLVIFQGNQAGWLLQLRKSMPRYFAALSVQGVVTGLLVIALIRGSWPAGSDLALGVIGAGLAFYLMWRWALPPGCRIRLSMANLLRGAQLLHGAKWLILMGVGLYFLNSAEVLLIGSLAGVEELGQYRAAMQLIGVVNPFLPLFFHALYPQLIDLQKTDPSSVLPHQLVSFGRLALLGVPAVLIAAAAAPFFYPLVFGAGYAQAALPFSLLFASKIVSVGVNIFMWGILARKLDHLAVVVTLGCASISLVLNLLLIPALGVVGACVINLGSQALLLLSCLFIMTLPSSVAPAESAPR